MTRLGGSDSPWKLREYFAEGNVTCPGQGLSELRRSWLALLVLCLWLMLIGFGLWHKTRAAVEPPVYDAATYFQKASNVWAGLKTSPVTNPFAAAPTVRPPGVVLMVAPFGFDPDFRNFYFRSTFFPVIAFAIAIYIAAWTPALDYKDNWNLVLATIFLTTLPMFYHFETVEGVLSPVYWGLTDNFLSGLAAIGTACILRSVKQCSRTCLAFGSVIGALCVFVKPVGFLIFALLAAAWISSMLLRLRFDGRSPGRSSIRRFLWFGVSTLGGLFVIVLWVCYGTAYFSPENIQFGRIAVSLLPTQVEAYFPVSAEIHASAGYGTFLSLGILFIGVSASFARAISLFKSEGAAAWGAVLSGILFLAVGGWFWLVATQVSEIRYFFPFALMATVSFLPFGLKLISIVRPGFRIALWAAWTITAMGLLILLLVSKPVPYWERLWGVNLSSGEYSAEVRQAQQFVEQLRDQGKDAVVYSLFSGISTRAFECVSSYEGVVHPLQRNFYVHMPVNWQSPPAYNADDIVNSDYIIFSPVKDQDELRTALAETSIPTFLDQKRIFNSWFSQLGLSDGVVVKSETKHNRLLEVQDRMRLGTSLNRFIEAHAWSADFRSANTSPWISPSELQDLLRRKPPVITDVNFASSYRLDAVEIENGARWITVNLWWEPLQKGTDAVSWSFFLHLLDPKGTIIGNRGVMVRQNMYHPPGRNVHFDSVNYPAGLSAQAVALGIGIYSPPGSFLMPDHGSRDWEGRRLLLRLPKPL